MKVIFENFIKLKKEKNYAREYEEPCGRTTK